MADATTYPSPITGALKVLEDMGRRNGVTISLTDAPPDQLAQRETELLLAIAKNGAIGGHFAPGFAPDKEGKPIIPNPGVSDKDTPLARAFPTAVEKYGYRTVYALSALANDDGLRALETSAESLKSGNEAEAQEKLVEFVNHESFLHPATPHSPPLDTPPAPQAPLGTRGPRHR